MPVTLKVDTVKSDCREESTVFQLGTYVHVHVHNVVVLLVTATLFELVMVATGVCICVVKVITPLTCTSLFFAYRDVV